MKQQQLQLACTAHLLSAADCAKAESSQLSGSQLCEGDSWFFLCPEVARVTRLVQGKARCGTGSPSCLLAQGSEGQGFGLTSCKPRMSREMVWENYTTQGPLCWG